MDDSIQLRPICSKDVESIAGIAAATPGFTVPSKYIVWMFATLQGEFCQVAVDQRDNVIGYTLGMPTSAPKVGFSWQTAVAPEYRSRHVAALLTAHIALAASASGMTDVRFTCAPSQAETMTDLVKVAGIGEVEATRLIPHEWGIDEIEFRIRLS